ncbi:type I methionyl aminopeptidase [Halarsenatibacter silvermanii]|uniref:Methionine aminopeptidase n=1 Tax=Halarsenatibacter silvermanii TaxID=321763 RepID=A0A1G9NBU5_9FIRM|nr:type I methionyl aminopeptidase [Halarsenatibacter silvermanii]SDL83942.1 methionyl aminopeptidase [Halarsenatibacter silvermanii]
MIVRKSSREIEKMKKANKIVAEAHEMLRDKAAPGVSTAELDEAAEEFIKGRGGEPSFKGYKGYPASVCLSIDNEVVHGIPDQNRILKEGNILSIDIGVYYQGFHGDAARTIPIGQVDNEKEKLIDTVKRALDNGIDKARAGNRLTDISAAVQKTAEEAGFSVVRQYVGHGIGREMHEEPQIPNFGPPGEGPKLKEGMTLAIEPMINVGEYEVETLEDDWTVVTSDGSLSAHWEDSIALTDSDPLIMSRP